MISVIITAFKEPMTIGKAILSISGQISEKDEIIVIAPDKETLDKALIQRKRVKSLKVIKDKGEGKPAALNLAVSKAKGEILILTDGDVYLGNNAVRSLIESLEEENIGAVSGRPVSINERDNKFGFWAYMLTEVANEWRVKALKSGKRFFCSGYLFAIKKKLFPKLPENLLSEDGYISHKVYSSGFKIGYSENSEVYVKYPNNFRDWVIQKKRSAGGYNQIKKIFGKSTRSFGSESSGAFLFFKFVKNLRQFGWLVNLFFARIYLWTAIYSDINLKNKNREDIWKRVESTK